MTQEVAKRDDYAVARYGAANPYEAFANEGGPGIQGKLLTCRKGEWSIGADGADVPAGARHLMLIPSMMRGWLKWVNGVVVDAVMGYVKDNFIVPHRHSLGDLDESAWERDPAGNPRDPWSKCYRVLLIELSTPHGDVTFSGGSFGAQLALKEMCRVFSTNGQTDTYPVVELGTKARVSKNYGRIVGPWFTVVGWATIDDMKAGRKAGGGKAAGGKRKQKAVAASKDDLNDELPNWS